MMSNSWSYELSRPRWSISSLSPSTLTQLEDILIHIGHTIEFANGIIGMRCTNTLSACARPAQVAVCRILPRTDAPIWSTVSPLMRICECSLGTFMQLGQNLILSAQSIIFLQPAGCLLSLSPKTHPSKMQRYYPGPS